MKAISFLAVLLILCAAPLVADARLDVLRDGGHVGGGSPPTDFVGAILQSGGSFDYDIVNRGGDDLMLTGSPPVKVLLTQHCNVAVTQPANTTIAPNASETFTLDITPTGNSGHFGFIVSISSNEPLSPYKFSVSGTVILSSATQLVITTEPGGGTGGVAWAQQPVVEVRDAANAIDPDYDGPVTAEVTASTGTPDARLLGKATVRANAGVATFTTLAIDLAGTGYTITFTSGPLTPAVSVAFDITVGPGAGLHIGTQPGGASMGVAFVVQPVLHVVDAGGNVVTTDNTTMVMASIRAGTGAQGAILSGTTNVVAANGEITYTDLSIDLAGIGYKLQFVANGLESVKSERFGVAGPPVKLGVAVQPNGALPNTPFVDQPVIEILDMFGTVVSVDNTTVVTATLVQGPGALSGTLTATAVAGVATFTDLQADVIGAGYRIEFTSTPPLSPVTSRAFGVAGPPTQLGIRTQPGKAFAGQPFGQQPVIEVQDINGTWVPNDNTTMVEVSLIVVGHGNGNGSQGSAHSKGKGGGSGKGGGNGNAVGQHAQGANLLGTLVVQAVNGLVEYTDLSIDRKGTFRLRFEDTSTTLEGVTSNKFHVRDADAGAGCEASAAAGWPALLAALGGLVVAARIRRKARA